LQEAYAYLNGITGTVATVAEHGKNLNCLFAAAGDCRQTLKEEKVQIRVTTLAMLGYKICFNKVEPDPNQLQPLLDLPPHTNLKELKRTSGILDSLTILSGYLIFLPRRLPFCVQPVFPIKML